MITGSISGRIRRAGLVLAFSFAPSMAAALLGLPCPHHEGHDSPASRSAMGDRVATVDHGAMPDHGAPSGHGPHSEAPCTCAGQCTTTAPPRPVEARRVSFGGVVVGEIAADGSGHREPAVRVPHLLPYSTPPPIA